MVLFAKRLIWPSYLLMLLTCCLTLFSTTKCSAAPTSSRVTGDSDCMQKWLRMSGAPANSLTSLEQKTRFYQLSEEKIRREHKVILNALIPTDIVEKLKICTNNPSVCDGQAPCNSGQCAYNESSNRHECVCPSGLFGDQCQTDIDECLAKQHDCDVAGRAVCNNTHGSYLCHCRHGYCGEDGKNCEDVDECRKGIHGCHSNATCSNVLGSYSCLCVDGFSGDGHHCEEILCTDKNRNSRLCRQVESMSAQLSVIPRLEKKLEEQEKRLSSTSDTIMTLSRALRDVRNQTKIIYRLGHSQVVQRGCHGIAAWRYYPWANWHSGTDVGQLKSVNYNKQRNDTILRVTFHATLDQYKNRGCSQWYIKFYGHECSQPAPIITSIYTRHSDNSESWSMKPTSLSGFCNATTSAPITTGEVQISAHVRSCSGYSGDAYTGNQGFKGLTSFTVEEYCL